MDFTNKMIKEIAMQQSAFDANCETSDFKDLYKPKWSNALCEKCKELDVLGVGAYHNGELIGLAPALRTATPCGR